MNENAILIFARKRSGNEIGPRLNNTRFVITITEYRDLLIRRPIRSVAIVVGRRKTTTNQNEQRGKFEIRNRQPDF